MNPALARHVHAVIGHGLALKERLENGGLPRVEEELSKLRGLLIDCGELRANNDYSGDPDYGEGGGSRFLGAKYALACWLDEIFIDDSPFAGVWANRPLEVAVFGGAAERAWRFWDQAALAERRTGTDALEVFYWCVMLGFRGDRRDQPRELADWCNGVHERLRRLQQNAELPLPGDRGFATNVPWLRGRDRFLRAVKVGSAAALLLLTAIVFLVFS
jgi:type VI secretion system protein ImpK